jgi:hypothetical protein
MQSDAAPLPTTDPYFPTAQSMQADAISPSERQCELQLLEFALSEGKKYHFFICHHQGSGGDQCNILCLELRARGYRVWYDNGMTVATKRNLPGMKDGVTKSECLLMFLSGRKESEQAGESIADTAGEYEGLFTRWFCHELSAA